MGHALLLQIALFACIPPFQFARLIRKGSKGNKVEEIFDKKCLVEPTVELCDTILMSWSYNKESKKCENGFVCSDCKNRFESEEECLNYCPMKRVKRPMWENRNCRFWLINGGACQKTWLKFVKRLIHKMRRLLYYTGCELDKKKLFVYDFHARRCRVAKKRPPGTSNETRPKKEKPRGESSKARQRLREIIANRTLPPGYTWPSIDSHGHGNKFGHAE
uniref:Pancreatic trypsin inhibitor n=1 Tax=Rhipicephalus zambeziensis TaxID=60191 RepID=A0A224YBJ7_9ACAR